MDYYRKKFKPSKPANNENFVDILNELESKWSDMQPRIHECTGDRSKLQKQLSEIRSYIEYCQRVEEKVSEEQQERIKEITRKCKEVLVKYGNISEGNASGLKSPRPFRKVMSAEASDQAVSQNKVALVEVEEKLKSMRQRRLDRLSVFVAEQSKLSEERSNKNSGSNEIENAIKSIQQTSVEKKSSFKSITEENEKVDDMNLRRHSSESTDKSKSSSAKKFINKFNCSTSQTIGSSNEDLTKNHDIKNPHFTYHKSVDDGFQDLDHRQDSNRSRNSLQNDKERKEHKNNFTTPNRNSLQKGNVELKENHLQCGTDTHDFNPLLSPVGKQRRAVYLYDNECKFLENEKQLPVVDLTENHKQEHALRNDAVKPKEKVSHIYENTDIMAKNDVVLTTFGKTNQENVSKKLGVELKSKMAHVYENRAVIDKNESEKSETVLTTFGKSSNEYEIGKKTDIEAKDKLGHVYENKELVINDSDKSQSSLPLHDVSNPEEDISIKTPVSFINENRHVVAKADPNKLSSLKILTNAYENIKFKPKKSNSLPKLFIKSETVVHRRSNDDVHKPRSPPRSPMPLPRKTNNAERVLKKLQRNWDSLNQIIENDSDVDGDELEDLKKTWEEANILLGQYKARIDKLERKPDDTEGDEKLNEIKTQLKDVKGALNTFRGLKRDSSYKQLSSRLSTYFIVVNKINCSNTEALNQKRTLLSEIEQYIKTLENRVNRNETILLEILEAQVKTVGTKPLNITKV